MRTLKINDVIELNGNVVRVLGFNHAAGRVYLFPLEGKNPLPRAWDINDFELDSVQSTLRHLPEPVVERPWGTSKADLKVSAERWKRIQGIVSGSKHLQLLERDTRAKCLCEHAKAVGTTDRTLLADLRLWWSGGQKRTALLGKYFQSGRVSEENVAAHSSFDISDETTGLKSRVVFVEPKQHARGRKPVLESYQPFAIHHELRKALIKTAKDHYLADNTRSIRATADHVLRRHFALRDEKGVLLREADGRSAQLPPPGQRPTIAQVRYLLKKVLSPATEYSSRYSKADFDNNHSDASGSVSQDTVGPGDVYEIDATVIDCYVVAQADRATIIGKPTLYLVVDRKSRLIVGFYISLENASWNEAKHAIVSIAGDWEALCQRLNVPYDANDWPAAGILPNRFVGDRGEMLSSASDVVCDELDIPITNPPGLRSRRKCIVEGGFKTTQVALRDNVPGYEPQSNVTKRRGKHYDRDASLTLDELAAIYLRVVIAHNNKVMNNYPLPPQDVLKGLVATPVNLWRQGAATSMGALASYDFATLRRALMQVEEATVTQNGVLFRNCVYIIKHPVFKDWSSRASIRGRFSVRVAFNPGLVDEITIIDPTDSRNQYVGQLAYDNEHFAGYSFAEVLAIERARARLRRKGTHANTASRVGLGEDISGVSVPATAAMKKATKGMRLGSRSAQSKDARTSEARGRRMSANGQSAVSGHAIAELPRPVVAEVSTPVAPKKPLGEDSSRVIRDVMPGLSNTLLDLIGD